MSKTGAAQDTRLARIKWLRNGLFLTFALSLGCSAVGMGLGSTTTGETLVGVGYGISLVSGVYLVRLVAGVVAYIHRPRRNVVRTRLPVWALLLELAACGLVISFGLASWVTPDFWSLLTPVTRRLHEDHAGIGLVVVAVWFGTEAVIDFVRERPAQTLQ